MSNFSKRIVNGSDVISEYGDKLFDSNGKRILSDVEYIITTITINGKDKVIIRDVESDHDSVVLMRLMLYVHKGFDKIIEICNQINLSFDEVKDIIEEMISTLLESEQYELVAKLKGEFDDYVKNINKKTKRKSK
jgi:hypothetical protein